METKIIKVVFGGRKYTTTAKRTRTDYGQMFEFVDITLPDTFEVIFSNSNTSAGTGKKVIGSNQRVLIPDEYLATGQTIYAWILLHDTEDDGRHMYSIKSPVDDMPDTSPEEPTPVEQSVISQAITALNSAVTTTTQKALEASANADQAEQAAEGVESYAERAESAQQAAESARDRATQAETSARTSAATATEKASEASESAGAASQSALTAENASESASASATASAESASQASQSADTASDKASDASEYANSASTSEQTASQKASEAAQSASTATQAKTDAITAKTASETAQGLAESARDGAVTAKEDAESARDEAQSIADGISGKVEQIDSNTDRIESLEDDRYKPYATDTASGSIASFPDGADNIPLKSCIVQIEPVQDLHGQDSPYPAGGGKNLVDYDAIYHGAYDNTSLELSPMNEQYRTIVIDNLDAGTYTFSTDLADCFVLRYAENGVNHGVSTAYTVFTFTVSAKSRLLFCFRKSDSSAITEAFKIQIEKGSTATDFAPYENICPISGHTACEVVQTGKNLWSFDSSYSPSGYQIILNRVPFALKAGTYTFSAVPNIESDSIVLFGYHADGTRTEIARLLANTTRRSITSTISKDVVSLYFVSNRAGTISDIQLELGSTATDYEPYHSDTYPITFPSEAGIIYGGYIDPINGELVTCPYYASYNGETLTGEWISDRDKYVAGTTPTIGAQVVNIGAVGERYPLTAIDIKTLLGQNNIWADTGDVSVEYRADTTLYINKKIAEALASLT